MRRGAYLVTRNDRGQVLLVRLRGGPFKETWLLPGGGLEPGESFEEALRREVREETGCGIREPREIARYDVRGEVEGPFHFRVHVYRGEIDGTPAVGAAGEAVAWTDVHAADAHPVLVRELRDAGVLAVTLADAERRCARIGVRMVRIGG